MISVSTFPQRLTEIDDLTRPDHCYLRSDDACYFLGEYTARKGYAFSTTNQLILNFKKTLDKRDTPQWKYKDRAIGEAATAFRTALTGGLDHITLVPIPPSKAKNNPFYDDRLVRMLDAIRPRPPLDIRELILQRVSTEAVHEQANRPCPEQIQENYAIDDTLLDPVPEMVGLVDDVLTTGAHFRGAALRATEQPINTATAAGKCFLDMLGVFAEIETNLRRERQLEGTRQGEGRGRLQGPQADDQQR
jgi:hypothetical protein